MRQLCGSRKFRESEGLLRRLCGWASHNHVLNRAFGKRCDGDGMVLVLVLAMGATMITMEVAYSSTHSQARVIHVTPTHDADAAHKATQRWRWRTCPVRQKNGSACCPRPL